MDTRYRRPRRLRNSRTGFALGALVIICAAPLWARSTPPTSPSTELLQEYVLLPTPTRPVVRGEMMRDVPHMMMRWPRSTLTDEYVQSFDALGTERANTTLPRYLPVPRTAITEILDDTNAVIGGIPLGMRAITVRVDIESAVEGWAQSGSFVDVLLISPSRRTRAQEAQVIADNIRILSAGRSAEPTDGGSAQSAPSTVTLLTTQQQALAIKAASSLGKITFALRGNRDTAPSLATPVGSSTFDTAPAPQPHYRGTARGPDGKRYVLLDNSRWMERGTDAEGL